MFSVYEKHLDSPGALFRARTKWMGPMELGLQYYRVGLAAFFFWDEIMLVIF